MARRILVPLAFWAAGMVLAHHSMIFSGLAKVQGNLGVPRLYVYMMEHEYRWLRGDPLHARFWDPPMFHPAANTAAYSETMLGVAPLYWVWRVIGVPIDVASPLWLLTVSSLNFLAASFFLRRCMDRTPEAAGFGAFLFAFASARIAYCGLTQLLPGFYYVLAVHALILLFREQDRRRALGWAALFATAFVGQVYTCFYIAWFLGLALGMALVWSMALPSLRPAVAPALRRQAAGLAASVAAIGIAIAPFLIHSLRAAAEVGYRDYDEVETFLPRLQSWLYFGPDHWLYGWTANAGLFTAIPTRISEHSIGLGILSTLVAIRGLWEIRESPLGRIFGAVALTLLMITLLFPGGASLWALIYLIVPGAGAIRAVARVALILLLPASAGAAALVDRSRWRKPLLVGAVLLTMLEQGRSSPSYDRREERDSTAAIARRVDRSAAAFFYTVSATPSGSFLESLPFRVHVDAMMASLEAGVPTINGYSGWTPPGWPFESMTIVPRGSEAGIDKALQEWCRPRGIPGDRIQWVR